jgi:hypothetical protein
MTSPEFDPYEILGVRPGASEEEIRAAYREQAARYHPDKHRGNPLEPLAVEKLQAINRAREMLLDGRAPGRRRATANQGAGASARPVEGPRGPADLVSWLGGTVGTIVGVLFLLRFGVVILRGLFVVVRGAIMALFGLLRISPIFVIALMVGVAMLTGYWLKARHRER